MDSASFINNSIREVFAKHSELRFRAYCTLFDNSNFEFMTAPVPPQTLGLPSEKIREGLLGNARTLKGNVRNVYKYDINLMLTDVGAQELSDRAKFWNQQAIHESHVSGIKEDKMEE